jgi:DnaK suppressor protein
VAPTSDIAFAATIRAALEDERVHANARIAGLQHTLTDMVDATHDGQSDAEHDPDTASIAFERSQVAGLIESAHESLAEIDAAERRLDAGTYGLCETCGKPIARERLEARPIARTCIRCASAHHHS